MKVYFSKYRDHWVSPYTMIDYVFFWTAWSKHHRNHRWDDKEHIDRPEWVDKVSDFLVPVSKAIQWFLDKVHPEVRYVKVDYWDTWSMDNTLSYIILPMLKQLRDTQHGSPHVDPEDVPEELRIVGYEDWSTQKVLQFEDHEQYINDSWDITHRRWKWVLNEIIFAFECIVDDSWQDAFRSGNIDFKFVPCEDNPKLSTMVDGPNHTYQCDYEGMRKVQERISNGLRLFGRYYQGLWD